MNNHSQHRTSQQNQRSDASLCEHKFNSLTVKLAWSSHATISWMLSKSDSLSGRVHTDMSRSLGSCVRVIVNMRCIPTVTNTSYLEIWAVFCVRSSINYWVTNWWLKLLRRNPSSGNFMLPLTQASCSPHGPETHINSTAQITNDITIRNKQYENDTKLTDFMEGFCSYSRLMYVSDASQVLHVQQIDLQW